MHGLIFTAFRAFTESEYPQIHDRVWADERRFLATAAYTDDDFGRVLEAAATHSGDPAERVLRRFGMFAGVSTFRFLFGDFYASHPDTLAFLLEVESKIHETVRRTIPDATPPRLDITRVDDASVQIVYSSPRRLCTLLDGLVVGVGRFYGDRLRVEQTSCMLDGAPSCVFVVEKA